MNDLDFYVTCLTSSPTLKMQPKV